MLQHPGCEIVRLLAVKPVGIASNPQPFGIAVLVPQIGGIGPTLIHECAEYQAGIGELASRHPRTRPPFTLLPDQPRPGWCSLAARPAFGGRRRPRPA